MKAEFDRLAKEMERIKTEVAMMEGGVREISRVTGFPKSTVSDWRRTIRNNRREVAA